MPNNNVQSPTQAKQTKPSQAKPGLENEGEGNKTAARNYDEATERYVASGRVDDAAKKAKQALEGAEGDELREAEDAARTDGMNAPTTPDERDDDLGTTRKD